MRARNLRRRVEGRVSPGGESVRTANPVQTTAYFGVKRGFFLDAVYDLVPIFLSSRKVIIPNKLRVPPFFDTFQG